MNKIYNNAKMKVTSRFYKIDHLKYDIVKNWLKSDTKFSDEEIDLIYEYLGGSIAHIQRVIRDKDEFNSLQEYLNYAQKLAFSEINMTFGELANIDKDYLNDIFIDISKEIVKNGYFQMNRRDKNLNEVVDYFCQKEILFFEPLDTNIYPNSKIYQKAMELL